MALSDPSINSDDVAGKRAVQSVRHCPDFFDFIDGDQGFLQIDN